MSDEKKTTAAAKKAAAVPGGSCGVLWPDPQRSGSAVHRFCGRCAAKLAEKMEAIPVLKALTVPREKFAEMRVKVEQDGTREKHPLSAGGALLKDAVTNTGGASKEDVNYGCFSWL